MDPKPRGTFELTAKQMQQLQFSSGFAPHNEFHAVALTHLHALLSMTKQSRGYECEDYNEDERKKDAIFLTSRSFDSEGKTEIFQIS